MTPALPTIVPTEARLEASMTTSSILISLSTILPFSILRLDLIDILGAHHFCGTSPGNDCFQFAPGLEASAHIKNQFSECHGSGRKFVETRLNHISADAHRSRSAVSGSAHPRILGGTEAEDVFDVADRLYVVHDRRLEIKPEDRRKVGRFDARIRPLSLQRFEKARLLATNVGTCTLMDENIHIEARTKNILAEKTFRAGLLNRRPDDAGGRGKFTPYIDVTKVGIRWHRLRWPGLQ